jgi:thiamine-phosphate pyrophosphorylase
MKPLIDCRLYAFIDTAYQHGRKAAEIARQLCDGGSDLVQLRAKNSPPEEVRRIAEEIRPVLSAAGVGLVINDHLDVAKQVGAELCHLGQEDFFDSGYRHISELNRSEVRIGLSTHSPAQAQRAVDAQAHYIAIGPVFATGTKPGAEPVTLDYVRWAAANVRVPWFAIGGINLQRVESVLKAGARRICVVSAILNAPDVAAECRKFRDRLG